MLRTFSTFLLLGIFLSGQTTTNITTPNVFRDSELATYPQFGTKDYLRTIFRRETPKFELQGPIKLQDYVVGDKLELSLKAYLELALRTGLPLATLDEDLLKAAKKAGVKKFA